MLGPAHAVPFQSLSVKIAGQEIELVENYNKAYIAMDQLLPQASRVMNGAESLPLIEGAATTAETEPVLAKALIGGADGLGPGAPANVAQQLKN